MKLHLPDLQIVKDVLLNSSADAQFYESVEEMDFSNFITSSLIIQYQLLKMHNSDLEALKIFCMEGFEIATFLG